MINTTTTRLLHIDAKHECSMNSWIHSLGQLISMFKNISSWIIRLFLSIFFWDLALMPCLKVTNNNCVVEKVYKLQNIWKCRIINFKYLILLNIYVMRSFSSSTSLKNDWMNLNCLNQDKLYYIAVTFNN